MRIMKRVGKWWVELEQPEPENERYANQFALWCGIMLTILNILLAFVVMG